MSTSVENGQSEEVVTDSSTAKRINRLLSSSKTRHEGWRALSSFLPRCPDELFTQFCVSWMQNCCKIEGSDKYNESGITLLGNLFKISKNYQELKKSVSFFVTSQYFDFFFKHFLDSQSGWNCTKNCLLFYRGACGGFQEGLQKHLLEEVNKCKKIPVGIAECYALLPCIGGGGNDGVNYQKNWKSQFMKILAISHSILNDLYEDAEEFRLQDYEEPSHTYQQPETPVTMEYLLTQLDNYITVLNCMLLNQYPAPKTIPPDRIFQLICRGLAVSPKSLEDRQTSTIIALREALPHVHRMFLSLLEATIVSCKNLLYPYSQLVCKLVKQVLEWTDADSCYVGNLSVAELRVSAYETLCNWLAVGKSGSCVEDISGVVLSNAASDIVTKKAVVSLKAKRQSKDQEHMTRRLGATLDSRLCYPALKCLQFLLKFAGVTLKREEHKFLQETVVELLLEIQRTPAGFVLPPFDAPRCRKELYSLLLELVHQPCSKWPPPTHFALDLFSKGVNDVSPDVSTFCSAALNFTTIIIHPQYDNGGFPTLETSEGRDLTERNITWTEETSASKDGGGEGASLEESALEKNDDSASIRSDPEEKLSVASEDCAWNSEDSTTTVEYFKRDEREESVSEAVNEVAEEEKVEMVELEDAAKEAEEAEEAEEVEKVEKVAEEEEVEEEERNQNEEEPIAKKQKISEEPPEEGTPVKEEQFEAPPTITEGKGKSEPSEDSETTQGMLTPAENHPKKRYFLRSKTKASTEESDEGSKSGSSPEPGKHTPLRGRAQSGLPAATPSKRRKSALPRLNTNSEAEPKGDDRNGHEDIDEEKLKAAFDDSLAD